MSTLNERSPNCFQLMTIYMCLFVQTLSKKKDQLISSIIDLNRDRYIYMYHFFIFSFQCAQKSVEMNANKKCDRKFSRNFKPFAAAKKMKKKIHEHNQSSKILCTNNATYAFNAYSCSFVAWSKAIIQEIKPISKRNI